MTVCKEGIGPVIGVSIKGTQNAFRNLTNRMEEAVGDCTNIHITYPAFVYGFLHVLRANVETPTVHGNDVAIRTDSSVVDAIQRYHDVMCRIHGRSDIRNDTSRYEAVALALVKRDEAELGDLFPGFPGPQSPLRISDFFDRLYGQYDQRFVYAAPAIQRTTRRVFWHIGERLRADPRLAGFSPRTAS